MSNSGNSGAPRVTYVFLGQFNVLVSDEVGGIVGAFGMDLLDDLRVRVVVGSLDALLRNVVAVGRHDG